MLRTIQPKHYTGFEIKAGAAVLDKNDLLKHKPSGINQADASTTRQGQNQLISA